MGIVARPKGSVPEAAVTAFLRELPNYVVLRNEGDLFGNLQRGGDIDLLVLDREFAEHSLIRHLGLPIRVTRRSYVTEYFYEWGSIDLLPSIEWRGACYLLAEAVIVGRQVSERGRPVPSRAHEALIWWFTSLLWGAFFKEQSRSVIRQAVEVDGVAFRNALTEVAGKKWGVRLWQAALDDHAEMSAEWARSLRRAVWWRACFRSPLRTIQRYFAFVIAELRLRFEPVVPWIAILGVSDGSGKSSLTNEIVHRFAACPYANVKAFHCHARLSPRAREGEPITDPAARPPLWPIGSGLRLGVLAAVWLVDYWTRLVHLRAKGYILASDRTYFDLVIDQRYRGARARLARALWSVLPKPDLVFLLESEPDVHQHGKQEVPPSELACRQQAYAAFVRLLPGGNVLEASRPLSVLVDEVQRAIRAWMLSRSTASLTEAQASMTIAPIACDEASDSAPISVSRGDASVESGASC
jgi:hypothetical protein